MAAKNGGKAIFVKCRQYPLQIPCGSKLLLKLLYLIPEKSPAEPANTVQVKNFVEIDLSCTISKTNALLRFTQKFKMAAKNVGKAIWEEFSRKGPSSPQVCLPIASLLVDGISSNLAHLFSSPGKIF